MAEEFQKLLQDISLVSKVVSARCLSTGQIVSLRHVTGGNGIVSADNWYYEDTLLPPGAVRIYGGGEYVLDDSNILTPMKKKQMGENAEKSVRRQKILFYAGIAIVIGIVAFIIIKKHKK